MIINEEHKFIFVHVFRTGGSSVEHAFGKHMGGYPTHYKLEDVPNWKEYFSFGTVRNPWDRIVSAYNYSIRRNQFTGTFEEYVARFASGRLRTEKQYAQHDMIKNCSYIIRFEHLEEDFKEACSLVGVTPPALPHVWKTTHDPYTNLYTEEMKQTVYDASVGDIEEYGFTFESAATKNVGDRR